MTDYEESIKKKFQIAAKARIRAKNRGDQRYKDDSAYWEGGRCNWGGNHSLDEDCHTIALAFRKIDELKNSKSKLLECTSKEEFESVKQRLVRIAEEAEKGLQIKTGSPTSIFGVCCIWGYYKSFLDSQIKTFREKIRKHKENIIKENYSGLLELRSLQLEQKQIENKMDENKQKAMNEKDPTKKATLLQLINEDGEKLKENLAKQKQLPINNLGADFDPDKYKDDLIEAMKNAIEGNITSGSENSSRRNRRDEEDDNQNNNGENNSNNPINNFNSSENTEPDFFQNNQSLIIIGAIALLIFYLYYFQEEEPNYYDF